MIAVVDRLVQYPNRYKLTNAETGEVLGTFDFDEVTGTVQQVGTEINKSLFDSIATDLSARVKLSGGELANTIVTFPDVSGTAANVASGDTSATLWGKVKNWFSRLKALAFKDKVSNTDVADDAAIAQSKVSGLTNALAGKQPTITGGATSITDDNLTANRAVISDANGKVAVSPVTATELGYLDGVTSSVQTQFNNIVNGNTIVKKATADKNGNDIFNTYATKTEATAAAKNIFRISQDLTNATIGATTQVTVLTIGTGAIPKANDYVYDEWGNFARLVSEVGSGKWNAIPFAKARASYTTSNPPPYPVTSVAGKTGAVSLSKSDVGLSNVDNVKQYSSSNPPPYPVKSVNGKTGAVNLDAAAVGAATSAQGAKADSAAQPSKEQNWSVNQNFNAGFSALNGNFAFSDTTNIGMEIGRRDGTAGTPYIDFHTDGSSSTDYNSRILATGNQLQVTASGGFSVNGHNIEELDMVVDSGNAITMTAPASGDTVQAPANGWFCLSLHSTGSGFVTLRAKRSDGADKWGAVSFTTNYTAGWPAYFLPVKSGDYVRITFNNATVGRLQFIRSTSLSGI